MEKYLIVRCIDLNDQYECDADRRPIMLVDDWQEWLDAHISKNKHGHYEIYKVGFGGRLYRIYTYF